MKIEVPERFPGSLNAAMLAWIHDFAPYGVFTTDKDFRIQSWNRWMVSQSGKSPGEVLDHNLFELFPDLKERGLSARFERALVGEICVLSTALHKYLLPMDPSVPGGEFARMQQTARIAPLVFQTEIVGTIIVIEDVTEREAQALKLRRQHERDRILSWSLAHLLEALQPLRTIRELFCRVAELSDFDGYLLYLVESDERLKLQAWGGVTPELEPNIALLEDSGPLHSLLSAARTPRALERLDASNSQAAPLHELFGFRVCVLLPLETSEGFIGILCFGARNRETLDEGELELLSTIGKYLALALHKEAIRVELESAKERLNQHAQHLEREVNERTANLRETIGELETFSYTLAHDLRAPIRALIGYSDVLLEDYATVLPNDGKTIVQRLHKACEQLDELTLDLLEFSKVSRQDIKLGPVDLESIIKDVIALLPADRADVQVQKPLHSVLAHPGLLQQCVWNLIDNALKFSKEGHGPRISFWTDRVEKPTMNPVASILPPFASVRSDLESSPDSTQRATLPSPQTLTPRVRINVQDEGIGIPAGGHSKIFGIFERGTSSVNYEGSGIGLAIVARAMERMGGSYGVESQPGIGSRFWLELPAAKTS